MGPHRIRNTADAILNIFPLVIRLKSAEVFRHFRRERNAVEENAGVRENCDVLRCFFRVNSRNIKLIFLSILSSNRHLNFRYLFINARIYKYNMTKRTTLNKYSCDKYRY